MSSPKFMVFKLKDLRIPIFILLAAIAVFLFVVFRNSSASQTFAPSDGHKDGKYIAGISLTDAELDLVVVIENNKIVSVDLENFDAKEATLYKDLETGVDYVHNYVTATQSLDFPVNAAVPEAAMLLMDAVKVALSQDENATLTTSYQKVSTESLDSSIAIEDDLAADESIQAAENALETADNTKAQDVANKSDDDAVTKTDAQLEDNENAEQSHNSIMDEEIIESVEE